MPPWLPHHVFQNPCSWGSASESYCYSYNHLKPGVFVLPSKSVFLQWVVLPASLPWILPNESSWGEWLGVFPLHSILPLSFCSSHCNRIACLFNNLPIWWELCGEGLYLILSCGPSCPLKVGSLLDRVGPISFRRKGRNQRLHSPSLRKMQKDICQTWW